MDALWQAVSFIWGITLGLLGIAVFIGMVSGITRGLLKGGKK